MTSYVYREFASEEERRVDAMERLWDPGTEQLLDRMPIAAGMAVAEVGAGGGSVARELARRVGRGGSVDAYDLDPDGIRTDDAGVVRARRLDIRTEPLPAGRYDFVHARLLVEHVGLDAVARLAAGLRPGGTLLVEDLDCGSRGWYPDDPVGYAVGEALLELMSRRGYDRCCGRKLPSAFADAGLAGAQAEGRVRIIRSGTEDTEFFQLSLLAVREPLIGLGRVTADEFDGYLARMREPGRVSLSAIMVACWGRREG